MLHFYIYRNLFINFNSYISFLMFLIKEVFPMINSNFVSTGIDDFDKSINMLRLGDSIVCQVGTINDYKNFITPFINRARANNKIIVYFKFADKKP